MKQANDHDVALQHGRITPARIRHYRIGNWVLAPIAAITGILLTAFVAVHMFGNLKAFIGPQDFNDYAHFLRVAGPPLLPEGGVLWCFRIGLLIVAGAHIWATLLITWRAKTHRGTVHTTTSLISRSMWITGAALIAFVVIHILDLTTGALHRDFIAPTAQASSAYENLIASLSRPSFALIYLLAMAALALHLWHGLQLALFDLGLSAKKWRRWLSVLGYAIALVVPVVNMSFPLLILAGVIS